MNGCNRRFIIRDATGLPKDFEQVSQYLIFWIFKLELICRYTTLRPLNKSQIGRCHGTGKNYYSEKNLSFSHCHLSFSAHQLISNGSSILICCFQHTDYFILLLLNFSWLLVLLILFISLHHFSQIPGRKLEDYTH